MPEETKADDSTAKSKESTANLASATKEATSQTGGNKSGDEAMLSAIHRAGSAEGRNEIALQYGLTLPEGQEIWTRKALTAALDAKFANRAAGDGIGKEEKDPEKKKLREENAAYQTQLVEAEKFKRETEIEKRVTEAFTLAKGQPDAVHLYMRERKTELVGDSKDFKERALKLRTADGTPIYNQLKGGAVEKTLEEDVADWLKLEKNSWCAKAPANIRDGSGAHGSQFIPSGKTLSGLVYPTMK